MTAAEKRLLHSMLAEGCGVNELFAVIDAMLEVRNAKNDEGEIHREKRKVAGVPVREESLSGRWRI